MGFLPRSPDHHYTNRLPVKVNKTRTIAAHDTGGTAHAFSTRFATAEPTRRPTPTTRLLLGALREPTLRGPWLRQGRPSPVDPAGLPRSHPRPGQDAGSDRRHRRARSSGRGHPLLVTRADEAAWQAVQRAVPEAEYHAIARAITREAARCHPATGTIALCSAGTSDVPVAEEAAVTAELMGNTVDRLYDVGVAGIHRVLKQRDAPRIRARHHRRRRHGRRAAERGRRHGRRAGDRGARPASATAPASAASRRCSACSTRARTACRW